MLQLAFPVICRREKRVKICKGDYAIAGVVYAMAIIPLILHTVKALGEETTNTKGAGYVNDLFGRGTIKGLKIMWVQNMAIINREIIIVKLHY